MDHTLNHYPILPYYRFSLQRLDSERQYEFSHFSFLPKTFILFLFCLAVQQ